MLILLSAAIASGVFAQTPRVAATVPTPPPAWALLERHLLQQSSAAAVEFAARYQNADGELIWRTTGSARFDDLPESFYNWPVLYALGGDDRLKDLSFRAWDGTLRQLARHFSSTDQEFPKALDWFHISEGLLLFYSLALADPDHAANVDRARRYAGFYLGPPNYDPQRRMIRSPVTGSHGPAPGPAKDAAPWRWSLGMSSYGLPLEDVEGIARFDDLKDEANARRMGAAIEARMMQGDVPANLAATALVTHAWLLTGDAKYRHWVREYVTAWMDRARANGGVAPDNVGPDGKVGQLHGGKWWGGYYGWRWPHGYYNIGMALQGAAENARLVDGGAAHYLELPRSTMEKILGQGRMFDGAFLVPYKRGDRGWFSFQPMDVSFLASLWAASLGDADWRRIERVRTAARADWDKVAAEGFPSGDRAVRPERIEDCWYCDIYGKADWREVVELRSKEDRGHEAPWLRFLAGGNPGYPEEILRQSLGHVAARLRWIRDNRVLRVYDPRIEGPASAPDIRNANAHHWHTVNPVTTEALLQLTAGVPQQMYNGGLVQGHLRYFDAVRRRPGLPQDVAALVESVADGKIRFHLVNVSAFDTHEVIVQAGMYGQDRFTRIGYSVRADRDPEQPTHTMLPPVRKRMESRDVDSRWLHVVLPPAVGIEIEAGVRRFAQRASYAGPFGRN